MSILNVLLRPDLLLVAVDTLAEDATTGAVSSGAKCLLIPQHNVLLAARGSSVFFLRVYELVLQASYKAEFSIEQLSAEMGAVIDKLWPSYEQALTQANFQKDSMGTELVLAGWSSASGTMLATAYAKSQSGIPAVVQPLVGGLASPGEPLRSRPDSFNPADVLASGKAQAAWLNERVGRRVAGGRLLAYVLKPGQTFVQDLGSLDG